MEFEVFESADESLFCQIQVEFASYFFSEIVDAGIGSDLKHPFDGLIEHLSLFINRLLF